MRKVLSAVAIITFVVIGLSSAASAQYEDEAPAGQEVVPADVAPADVAAGGAQGGGGGLARTGDDSLPLLRIGAVLVTVGGLLVLTTRKRRAEASSPA